MHGHLVSVEIGIKRGADQGMKTDGLSLDQHWIKGLDPEPVKRRGPVQKDGMLPDHLFQDVPHLVLLFLDHLFGALDGRDVAPLLKLVEDKRLEELQGHLFRKTALMQLQLWTDDDHGAARIIDPLPQEVLAETSLLSLQHVGEGLQGPLVRTPDRPAAPTVVEQGVDRFLRSEEHTSE